MWVQYSPLPLANTTCTTNTHAYTRTQDCFSYCLILVTYHTLLVESKHWRNNQLLSSRKHKMKWEKKTQKDCRVFSVTLLSRPTLTNNITQIKLRDNEGKMRIHSDTVNSAIWVNVVYNSYSLSYLKVSTILTLLFYIMLGFHTLYCISSKHWCNADFSLHIKAVNLYNSCAVACWLACFWICSLCQCLVVCTS